MRKLATFAFLVVAAAPLPGAAESAVTYLPAEQVSAAFAKGAPLLEAADLKVHASRRDAAGVAEIHARDTDVIYVVEGSATLVTGGSVVGGRTVADSEIRGRGIEGGETRRIGKGDVIVVSRGVPHWFRDVPGPFTYYVVKVTGAP